MSRSLRHPAVLGACTLLLASPAALAKPPAADDDAGDGVAAPLMLASPQVGRKVSGGTAQLGASDDQRLVIEGVQEKNFSRTTTLVAARSPMTTVSSLGLTVEAGVGQGGDLNVKASMLDFDTGEWVRVGTWHTGADRLHTVDDVEDPQRFVHSFSGLLWLRLETRSPRPRSPQGSVVQYDVVSVTVRP